MAIRTPIHRGKPEINLDGPDGNAFVLLANAYRLGQQLGLSRGEIQKIQDDMKSSDYEHLIQTFDKHFGDYVDLVRGNNDYAN